MRALIVIVLLLGAPAVSAQSAVVTGQVIIKEGAALLAGTSLRTMPAVIYVADLEEPAPPLKGEPPKMSQRDKAFDPRLIVVQKGSPVTFPNDDKIFHNVFSLSRGNQFDLGIYRQGESKTVRFTKTGVVDVFCNIHPQMIASILVVPNRHFVVAAENGSFRLQLPPGKRKLVAWWPRGAPVERVIDVVAGAEVKVDFELVDSGRLSRHTDKEGLPYGRYK